jgi:hypothetical protein
MRQVRSAIWQPASSQPAPQFPPSQFRNAIIPLKIGSLCGRDNRNVAVGRDALEDQAGAQ